MATTKKATAKKKTTSTRKPAAKRTTRKKHTASNLHETQSFKIVSSETPFMTFTFTRQTVYWLVFMLAVLALGLWIINLQDKINRIYDQVDANSSQLELLPEEYKAAKEAAKKSDN